MTARSHDLGATVAGVHLAFCAMNAPEALSLPHDLRRLVTSRTGAIVLRTATVHPFLHPEFRSLHNPGYDKLVPLVRELVATGGPPVVATIAGANVEEYGFLARAFADAGTAWVEANLADPWVAATVAPFEDPRTLRTLARRMTEAAAVPVAVRLPERTSLPYARVRDVLADAAVRIVVVRNDFGGLEKFVLEAGTVFDVVAIGGIHSGYDVRRALAKGAKAVQVRSALVEEGPGVFARLEREMRMARG